MTRKIISVPPLCKVSEEAGRTYFEIEREDPANDISVWWDRIRNDTEVLLVRQEAEAGAPCADVLMLTLSQVYSLIDALNRAVMAR